MVLKFWAPWCNKCRMIAPHVDELAVRQAATRACRVAQQMGCCLRWDGWEVWVSGWVVRLLLPAQPPNRFAWPCPKLSSIGCTTA